MILIIAEHILITNTMLLVKPVMERSASQLAACSLPSLGLITAAVLCCDLWGDLDHRNCNSSVYMEQTLSRGHVSCINFAILARNWK